MNIPEEFGKYLLLKKLTEDPLGETFRAGRLGQEGMEQVVLLRVFNGKGMDGEKLWHKIGDRGAIQQALKSPNIGNGVDLGRVRSYPYVAYDYISGKNLSALLTQASRQFSPIPADHALLIAERISLSLAAAYETRVEDERLLHGFVTPHLVMISNEGETRLLGFEAAPGLRDLAAGAWRDSDIVRYVAPEALTGSPLARSDDVYSLGAILFELLTGEDLPAAPAEGYAAVIDSAVLGNEGTPFPPAVAALLKKSLVPRDQRIADTSTWHKTLSKLMIDGHYAATTFNLAFFMHNLFREEIERESQEIQAEKTLQIPRRGSGPITLAQVTQAMPVTQAAAAQPLRDLPGAGVREVTLPGVAPAAASAEPSKKGLWIGIAAALLVAAAAGGYFMFGRSGNQPTAEPAVSTAATAPNPQNAALPLPAPGGTDPALAPGADPGAAAAPAGPTPEELQAQIQQMFDARSKEMEAKLKGQYDDRIKQLKQQLEDSQKAAAEPERPKPAERPAPVPIQPEPAPAETRRPDPAPAQAQTAPATPQPQTSAPAVSAPAPQQTAPATTAPQAAPRQPQVQYGDLVQAGPGVSPPKVRSQPMPHYPVAAQRFNKAAVVEVRVLVDEKGQVISAERLGAKAGYGLDEAALDTARRSTFNPASKEGVRVKMWTVLKIAFRP
jgi:TonB family protein